MATLQGKGFLIWKLESVMPVDRMIEALRRADCDWVCIKVANGLLKSNTNFEVSAMAMANSVVAEKKTTGLHVPDPMPEEGNGELLANITSL